MNLRVIGRYGRFPVKGGGTSSFIIDIDGSKIILDMGCSSLSRIQEYVELEDIHMVMLSHLHGDHIADFKAFTYMVNIYCKQGALDKDIIVYLPKTPMEIVNELRNSNGIEYRFISDNMVQEELGSRFEFYKMSHPIETYGIRITSACKCIAYTADTKECDSLPKLVANADLVVGDACTLEEDYNSNSVHISIAQLAKCVNNNNAKKLLLAHLPDKNLDRVLAESLIYHKDSELAEECKLYYV